MIKKVCEICNKEFEVYKYREKTALYCSKDCYHKSTRKNLDTYCKNCGKVFRRKCENDIKSFCSLKCSCEFKRNKPKIAKLSKDGYKRIWLTDGSSVTEHQYVMEKHIGRKLEKNECVHHIDGNRANNDINNLQLMTIGEHSKLHRKKEVANGKKLFGRCYCNGDK